MTAMAPPLPMTDAPAAPATPRSRSVRNLIYTAAWFAMGAAAVYFLAPQAEALADSIGALAHANPVWLLAGLALVAARYAAAALTLAAAAGSGLPLLPTTMVQLATSFVGRLTPEGIGWLVLNQRYLEKAGLSRASAGAALALRVAAGGVTRVAIVGVVAVLVGREAFAALDLSFPWLTVVLGIAALALVLGATGYALRSRTPRIMAALRSAASAIADALHSPRRAAALWRISGDDPALRADTRGEPGCGRRPRAIPPAVRDVLGRHGGRGREPHPRQPRRAGVGAYGWARDPQRADRDRPGCGAHLPAPDLLAAAPARVPGIPLSTPRRAPVTHDTAELTPAFESTTSDSLLGGQVASGLYRGHGSCRGA